MLDLADGLIKLLVLPVGEVKLFLSALNISQKVRLRLVGPFVQSLVEFDISGLVLDLVF